jgi:Icc-related predicted phosphoesterase
MTPDTSKLSVAAVADTHCARSSQGAFQALFSRVNESADVLLLAGDLTDYGLPEEAQVFAKELSAVKVPMLAVLGNHDYESGQEAEVKRVLTQAGVQILDGDAAEVHGVGFAGVKGFGGGFDRLSLQPWGEEIVKRFVHESVQEALKLESALVKIGDKPKVVLLHYAPVAATVEGEPPEIFPLLGSSRLEDPINRYAVSAVFHGHAHHGQLEGRTREGVPVYNVAMPILKRERPQEPSFLVVAVDKELHVPAARR